MSTLPKMTSWVEWTNKCYSLNSVQFHMIHPHPGFIDIKISFTKSFIMESPVFVGDITYIYNILHSTLLSYLISYIISESYVRITYQIIMDDVPYPVNYTIGESIQFTDSYGMLHPNFFRDIWLLLDKNKSNGMDSSRGLITCIYLRVAYFDYIDKMPVENKQEKLELTLKEISRQIAEFNVSKTQDPALPELQGEGPPQSNNKKINNRKKKKKFGIIEKLRPVSSKRKTFYVADMETIRNAEGVHEPYAIGLLKCHPQEEINKLDISTWFYEDHMQLSSYCERSRKILSSFVKYVEKLVRMQRRSCVVYFHNMGRFDGIILLKHLVNHHTNYTLKPLMRNGVMYEIKVIYSMRHSMIFRDSCQLLPGSLASLANDLCQWW